ncbi:MAG: YbaB/EbfC family nucleoid-associated protein [Sediminispirochaetaceae bacterium]
MNPMDLFKNLQNLQSQFGEMQEKLKQIHASGTSGGEMVRIDMNGQMEVSAVHIEPEAVDPDDVKMLEDLILAAFLNASAKVKEKLQQEAANLTGGMDIPPGFMGS